MADSKLVDLTADTTPDSTDLLYVVGDPAGTPVDRKSTIAQVVAAGGAVLESDTSTASMSFVIDEDNMASDSATKVPTQQSVKAYVDGSSGGAPFKFTIYVPTAAKTTTSTSRTPIDSTNLAFIGLTGLAVGDVVRCKLQCTPRMDTTSNYMHFDFEVDQPTSANTYVAAGVDNGVGSHQSAFRDVLMVEGWFTVTEAGTHSFRPVWWVTGGTATIDGAASGNNERQVIFSVEKLGPPS